MVDPWQIPKRPRGNRALRAGDLDLGVARRLALKLGCRRLRWPGRPSSLPCTRRRTVEWAASALPELPGVTSPSSSPWNNSRARAPPVSRAAKVVKRCEQDYRWASREGRLAVIVVICTIAVVCVITVVVIRAMVIDVYRSLRYCRLLSIIIYYVFVNEQTRVLNDAFCTVLFAIIVNFTII